MSGPSGRVGRPPTYFWQSIVCLLLFFPTGIPAVAYSLLVTKREQIGDGPGSFRASQMARLWCIVTLVACVAALLLGAATGLQA